MCDLELGLNNSLYLGGMAHLRVEVELYAVPFFYMPAKRYTELVYGGDLCVATH